MLSVKESRAHAVRTDEEADQWLGWRKKARIRVEGCL